MAKVTDLLARLVRGPGYWEQRCERAEAELYRAKVALDASEKHAAHVEAQRAGWKKRAREAERARGRAQA